MVKLPELPDRNVVRALKGKVDFYRWKGIHVARAWPRKSTVRQTEGSRQQQRWLQRSMDSSRIVSSQIKGNHFLSSRFGRWTWRDHFMVYYFGTIKPDHDPGALDHPHETPFPNPDPLNHYWGIIAYRMVHDEPNNPVLEIIPTQPMDIYLHINRRVPAVEQRRVTRPGILYHAGVYHDHSLEGSAFFGSTDNNIIWRFPLVNFAINFPNRWHFLKFISRDAATGHVGLGHSPIFALFIRERSFYEPGSNSWPGGFIKIPRDNASRGNFIGISGEFFAPFQYPPVF